MRSLLEFIKLPLTLVAVSAISLPLYVAGADDSSETAGQAIQEDSQQAQQTTRELDEETEQELEKKAERAEEAGPTEDMEESLAVLKEMQKNPDMQQLLDRAQGVFLVPDYVTAALLIGGSGGEGVLLKKDGDSWSNPVFYDMGSISGGLQAGVAAGSFAMVLLSSEALDKFQEETNFEFTADAGYSIVNWSQRARADIGLGTDAVVWSDTEGLFGDLAVGVTGLNPDEDENEEYYGKEASPEAILAGDIENPHEQELQQALREE